MIRPKPCRPDMDGRVAVRRWRGFVPLSEPQAIAAFVLPHGNEAQEKQCPPDPSATAPIPDAPRG